jgi:L-rhamnose-H+ transport protein
MQTEFIAGAGAVLAAGLLQGTFALPMKYARSWNHENIWLVFAFTGLVAAPWLLTLATIPHLREVYSTTSYGALWAIIGFGALWGIGATLTGIGLQLLGVGLGLSILIGLSASVGSLIPILVLTPESLGTHQGHLFLAGSAVMLVGIAIAARAGALRDPAALRAVETGPGSVRRNRFATGLIVCICSGVCSSALNLSYAFGAEAIQHARLLGATATWASNVIAAPATSGGFLANFLYCGYMLRRNGSWRCFSHKGTARNWMLGALMAILWFGGLSLYGVGALHMGKLGTSLGWPLLMGMIILTSNAGGYMTGEWTGVDRTIRYYLYSGMAIILLALGVLAMAQRS